MAKTLVACEESQRVCIAFRQRGHEAYSCDIQECSGGHPEWHIMGDVLPLLNGRCTFTTMKGRTVTIPDRWDLIIAHPPCTYTSNAGARHLWRGHKLNIERYYMGMCGKALFVTMLHADCDKIAVENPQPSKIYEFPQPSQAIQPYEYGHPYTKKTLLWLKNLPLLKPTNIVAPIEPWCPSGSYSCKHNPKHRGAAGDKDRAKMRSKTFDGIAVAMAEQWGEVLDEEA